MSCKTNISEKYFCTKIMRNFGIYFTLKSFLHPVVQSHNSVHIFFPSLPSSSIIHGLEINFLQPEQHSGR